MITMGLLDEREEDDNIVGGDDNDDDDDNDDKSWWWQRWYIKLFRTCFLGTVEQKVFTHTLVRVPDCFPNLWIHLWWYISIDRFQAQIRVGPMDSPWEKLGG